MWRTGMAAIVVFGGVLALSGCSLFFGDKWVENMMTSPEFVCALIQGSDEIEFGDLPDDAVVAFIDESDDGTARAIVLRGKEERLQFFCEGCDGDCSEMESLWGDRFLPYPDVETARRSLPAEYPDVARIVGPSDCGEKVDGETEK